MIIILIITIFTPCPRSKHIYERWSLQFSLKFWIGKKIYIQIWNKLLIQVIITAADVLNITNTTFFPQNAFMHFAWFLETDRAIISLCGLDHSVFLMETLSVLHDVRNWIFMYKVSTFVSCFRVFKGQIYLCHCKIVDLYIDSADPSGRAV